ncbi:peptidase associated/transthyretin-like domain-containing protein [Daejeonella lutea]|uniref:CarboxypepD_reg-like domain-containing protein n=1 Tax=Daejeonella lutea TaxID=572036 RepID=A0A1T5DI90_9SPHI|nr:hypothetical protein [Daejeonella lutea]SKB71193.1 hypothetical protein SAMN05661099_2350 [Daejeonella lutea]
MRKVCLVLAFTLIVLGLKAQHTSEISNLYKRISLDITKQPVGEVLDQIARKGDFYFSYSGNAFNRDSLVTINVKSQTVRDVLDKIFLGKVDYKESNRYVILRSTLLHFSIEPDMIKTDSRHYMITGKVVDIFTGKTVPQASVYEKRLLESTLTDNAGYFRMRIRGDYQSVILTASKEAYRDTSIMFLSTVTVKPEGYVYTDGNYLSYASNIVERLGIGRFLVSTKQRVQSLNISGFLTNSPFQASLIPGMSSHGMFSSQVINKASLNLLGGYTAGVGGVEVGGLFNINKGDVKHLQVAGLTNLVGGSVQGFQVGGLLNSVLDSVHGVQTAGIANDVRKNVDGWQAAGILNHVRKDLKGIQVAGITSLVSNNMNGVQISGISNISKRIEGMQISGIANIAGKEMRGMQIGGIFNFAHDMRGMQIGLINFADTSSGVSVGLINWINKGYHKLSLSSNEVLNYQAGIKTGNSKLYSILIGAATFKDGEKVFSAGLGFGHDFIFNDRFSTSAEISSQGLYLGNFDSANILSKAQLNLQLSIVKGVSVFAGPSYSVYRTDPAVSSADGFQKRIGPAKSFKANQYVRNWIGWSAGITLF